MNTLLEDILNIGGEVTLSKRNNRMCVNLMTGAKSQGHLVEDGDKVFFEGRYNKYEEDINKKVNERRTTNETANANFGVNNTEDVVEEVTFEKSPELIQLEKEGQWVKGKSCDTFAPIGPFIATADENNAFGYVLKSRLKDIMRIMRFSQVNGNVNMTQNTFDFTRRLLMVLSVALSLALIIFLEVAS